MKTYIFLFLVSSFGLWSKGSIALINEYKAKAETSFEKKDFVKAASYYQILIDSFEVDEPELLLNLAQCYYNSEEVALAEKSYQSLVSEQNKYVSSIANSQLGFIYKEKKKYKEALDYFKQALRDNPTDNKNRYNYELIKKLVKEEEQKDEKKDGKDGDDKKDEDKKDEDKKENKDKKDQEKKDQTEKKGDDKDKTNKEKGEKDKNDKEDKNADKKKKEEKDSEKTDDKTAKEEADKKKKEEEEKEKTANPNDAKDKKAQEKKQQEKKQKQRLQQMNMSAAKAKMILDAMKNNETKYYQQLKKKSKKKKDNSKPDW